MAKAYVLLGFAGLVAYLSYLFTPYLGVVWGGLCLLFSLAGLRYAGRFPTSLKLIWVLGSFYLLLCLLPHPVNATSVVDRMRKLFGLSLDNELPQIFAEALRRGDDVRHMGEAWRSSDRPPLQSGIYLAFSFFRASPYYQALGCFLNLSWIPALSFFFSRHKFPDNFRRLFFVFTALSGFFFVNSVYVWPKLLAASYFFLALSFLPGAWWAGLALGLAFLSHSGVMLAAPLFAVWLWEYRKNNFRALQQKGPGLSAFLAMVVTWILYQKLYDPPGDRLTKLHLTGIEELRPESLFFLLREVYEKLTFNQWWDAKLGDLWSMTFKFFPSHLDSFAGWRVFEFFSTLGALSVAGMVGLGIFLWHLNLKSGFATLQKLLIGTLLSFLFWILIMFSPFATVVHQGSYATQIALFVLAISGLTLLPSFYVLLLLGLQILVFLGPWTIGTWFLDKNFLGVNIYAFFALFVLVLSVSFFKGARR